jgi:hypothetical protein
MLLSGSADNTIRLSKVPQSGAGPGKSFLAAIVDRRLISSSVDNNYPHYFDTSCTGAGRWIPNITMIHDYCDRKNRNRPRTETVIPTKDNE